jgi:hypothetical protein
MNRADIEREMDAYMEDEAGLPPVPDGDLAEAELVPPVDTSAAQAVMRRLKRLATEAATITDAVDTEVARLTRFRDDRLAGIARAALWDERNLEAFMRNQAAAKGGKRTLKVADGELRLRAQRTVVVVTDPVAFMHWVAGEPPLVIDGVERQPAPEPRSEQERAAWAADVEAVLQAQVDAALPHADLVRIKLEPSKDALGKLGHPDLDADGVAPLSLPDGELVPGVELRKDPTDTFGYTIGED